MASPWLSLMAAARLSLWDRGSVQRQHTGLDIIAAEVAVAEGVVAVAATPWRYPVLEPEIAAIIFFGAT